MKFQEDEATPSAGEKGWAGSELEPAQPFLAAAAADSGLLGGSAPQSRRAVAAASISQPTVNSPRISYKIIGNSCNSFEGAPRGAPEEETINSKSKKSLGNTAFWSTAHPHGAAGRAARDAAELPALRNRRFAAAHAVRLFEARRIPFHCALGLRSAV